VRHLDRAFSQLADLEFGVTLRIGYLPRSTTAALRHAIWARLRLAGSRSAKSEAAMITCATPEMLAPPLGRDRLGRRRSTRLAARHARGRSPPRSREHGRTANARSSWLNWVTPPRLGSAHWRRVDVWRYDSAVSDPKPKVLMEPAQDGGFVVRVVARDGLAVVEHWDYRTRRWMPGGASLASAAKMPPAGSATLARLGVPVEDWPSDPPY
jgi:hypothetical protein